MKNLQKKPSSFYPFSSFFFLSFLSLSVSLMSLSFLPKKKSWDYFGCWQFFLSCPEEQEEEGKSCEICNAQIFLMTKLFCAKKRDKKHIFFFSLWPSQFLRDYCTKKLSCYDFFSYLLFSYFQSFWPSCLSTFLYIRPCSSFF